MLECGDGVVDVAEFAQQRTPKIMPGTLFGYQDPIMRSRRH